MAGLFSSGEQDMLGNIVQQRQQANQALGSGYGKYGGIVQAAGGLIDTGTDAMFGGKVGASDPRMQQMEGAKAIFAKVSKEMADVTSPAFYERLAVEFANGGFPEQAEKAKTKARELAPKDNSMELLKLFTPASVKAFQAAGSKDFNLLSDRPGETKTEVVEVDGQQKLINSNTGKVIAALGVATKRTGVSVTVGGAEAEYSKTVGKGSGEKDLKFVASAQAVTESLPKMYETATLIATSDDLLTGIGSGFIKDFYRIVDQFTADKTAGKKVSDTEYLDALMGSEVFTQINALGIGARGLDTPAEREFLRSVMTGTTTLNDKTLKKLTNLRIDVAERAIKKYNEKLASGQLDRYMESSGETLEPIEIQKRSSETEITRLVSSLKSNSQYANLTDKQAERALRKAGKIK